jgi:hypothetical protein
MGVEPDVHVVELPYDVERYLLNLLDKHKGHILVRNRETGQRILTIISSNDYESFYDDAMLARDPQRFGFVIQDSPELEEEDGQSLEEVLR